MAARKGSENLNPPIRSAEEARKKGKKGGIASGVARRKKKTMRELLEIAMELPSGDKTTAEAITAALLDKALSGDVKAYEVVRDTLGENPKIKMDNQVSGGIEIKWQE
ncbi:MULTISPECIES: hypothetical protein [Desulfovibrio]|uniref:DUF5681 domain-containing protein n=1 Tax=Desulfovibrio desulfuricans TaxID=876 RepID=A0AA94L1A6_DESDE|nr:MULTISPECIES: hypothetical protein [Desulfovibrio]ATD81140.1 hypothetical protein CNY67_06905 [Desulfovibrio sp. G11]SFW23030.1 hypothetical protein SAMN02910291_00476 [Desulfovibrio desulfuricans]SPD36759.1 Hypothetical protein DSVG11_2725 [Desulfovibrio sp. G11]